ncbi:hypothetical protein [Phytoactinopolyspora mesophila]|uniref:Uncharacterized protein n=1 Tax=Phytoactinopolyspora mesophila TaxID=2650750 RepID=A0A7K3MAU1_9ACTN|nr:hypothetical protein [Phytoactinopolyspora mesophila]NDL60157.1 hypothetical protein [Phytoactinopolyspora mesophila]
MQNLCYGCLGEHTRWRGPKYGWLCLRCFSETTQPAVQVANAGDDAGEKPPGPRNLPVVTCTEKDKTWTLHILDPESEEVTERHSLGTDLDPEQAVDEAKWLLSKKNWSGAPYTS